MAIKNNASICSNCADRKHCEWFCGGECFTPNNKDKKGNYDMKIEIDLKDLADILDASLEYDDFDERESVTSSSIKESLKYIILKDVAEDICDSTLISQLSSSLLQNDEFKEKVVDKLANMIVDRFEKKKAVQDLLPKFNQVQINKEWEEYFDKRISACISKKFK